MPHPTTYRHALIALLLGEDCALPAGAAWARVVELAGAWGVLPVLHARLEQHGYKSGVFELGPFAAKCREAFTRTALVASNGAHICGHLERCGVPYVLFKGLAAICHLYSGPEERSTIDADVLIREEDLQTTVLLLRDLGLSPEHGGDLDAYQRAVRNMPGFGGNESLAFHGPPFHSVDLHWRLGARPIAGMHPEEIIERGVRRSLLGTEVRVVSAVDGLVLGAHHALRNRFVPDEMIREVLDARRWLGLLERQGTLDDAVQHVRGCRIEAVVYALGVLGGCANSVAPLKCRDGVALIELFQMQARGAPFEKDLAHLTDARALLQVLRGAFSGWDEYRRCLAELETQQTGGPAPIGRRVRDLFASIWSARREGLRAFRALRTLARAKAAYQDAG